MRTLVGWLAAAALGLAAASSAHAQQIQYTPFQPSNGVHYNGFQGPSNGFGWSPFGGLKGLSIPSRNSNQPTFPSPGATLSGPSRLINLLPNLHGLSNTHVIGYSMFPTQTDQYLAQFGFQRLR